MKDKNRFGGSHGKERTILMIGKSIDLILWISPSHRRHRTEPDTSRNSWYELIEYDCYQLVRMRTKNVWGEDWRANKSVYVSVIEATMVLCILVAGTSKTKDRDLRASNQYQRLCPVAKDGFHRFWESRNNWHSVKHGVSRVINGVRDFKYKVTRSTILSSVCEWMEQRKGEHNHFLRISRKLSRVGDAAHWDNIASR